MKSPRVSVVMTAYNAADTIADAIQSVIAQDMTDWELVIVDDGSRDTTLSVVKRFDDPRIRLIRSDHVGRSAAVNLAVQNASAPLIAINDADDESLPSRLRIQCDALDAAPDVDVMGAQILAWNGTRTWPLHYPVRHADIAAELNAGRMPVAHAAVMFRRDWFKQRGGLSTAYSRVEDFELYFRSRSSTVFAAVDAPLLRYRHKALGYARWRSDEALHARVVGPDLARGPSRLRYARYRLAVWTQQRGVRLSSRGRSQTRE